MSEEKCSNWLHHATTFEPPIVSAPGRVKNSAVLWLRYGLTVFFRLLWPTSWDIPIKTGWYHYLAGGLIPCLRKESGEECPLCQAIVSARKSGAEPKVLSRYEAKWLSLAWIWLHDFAAPPRQDSKQTVSAARNTSVLLIAPGELDARINDQIKKIDPEKVYDEFFGNDRPVLRTVICGSKPHVDFEIMDQNLVVDTENISGSADEILAALNTPELQRAALEKISAVPPPTPKAQSRHSSEKSTYSELGSIVVDEPDQCQTDVTDTSSITCLDSDEEVLTSD